MTDTPIYDRLSALPRPNIRSAAIIADHVLTVPVSREVQDALHRLEESHYWEAVATLAPFGLHPYDIAQPEYRRILTVEDITFP